MKKLTTYEKTILSDLLRYLLHEMSLAENNAHKLGRLALLSPEFFASIVGSIADKLELHQLSEYLPARQEKEVRRES